MDVKKSELLHHLQNNHFKINRENLGEPVFFLIRNETEFLKMVNSVIENSQDLEHFEEFIQFKTTVEEFKTTVEDDEDSDDIPLSLREFYDLYNSEKKVMSSEYTDIFVRKSDVVFIKEIKSPLIFFIYFSDGFDRFGDNKVEMCAYVSLDVLTIFGLSFSGDSYE